MKAFCFVFIFLTSCFSALAQNNSDTIHWRPDYKLKWEDFQGTPDSNSTNGAITHSGLFYYFSYTKKDTSIVITVTSVFDKKKSWVKKEVLNTYSLNHEQGHFNITEVYSRQLRLALKKYKLNLSTVNSDVKRIYDSVNQKMRDTQLLYDRETTYPKLRPIKQKEWDKKIAAWLKSTN